MKNTFEQFSGQSFSEEEIEASRKTLVVLIGSDETTLKSVYMAGQILMWNDLKEKYLELSIKIKQQMIEGYIEENESILKMAKIHMDTRAIIVLRNRITKLKEEFLSLPS